MTEEMKQQVQEMKASLVGFSDADLQKLYEGLFQASMQLISQEDREQVTLRMHAVLLEMIDRKQQLEVR